MRIKLTSNRIHEQRSQYSLGVPKISPILGATDWKRNPRDIASGRTQRQQGCKGAWTWHKRRPHDPPLGQRGQSNSLCGLGYLVQPVRFRRNLEEQLTPRKNSALIDESVFNIPMHCSMGRRIMSNIIKFPKKFKQPSAPVSVKRPAVVKKASYMGWLLTGMVKVIWMIAVLVWPVLRWVLSIVTFLHLLRVFYHWDTPGAYAGWTFLAHFVALTALTLFVAFYRPKGF